MNGIRFPVRAAAAGLLLGLLACRPVIAIGWGELLILFLLVAFLLGPLILRVARALSKLSDSQKGQDQK